MIKLAKISNYILQLFFIRLTIGTEIVRCRFTEVSLMADGSYAAGFDNIERQEVWRLIYWVVPFTGWRKPIKVLGGQLRDKRLGKV